MPETPPAKRVLMVAYHFPPCQGSSGIQRTLKFATYLRDRGWRASVLTVHPGAYAARSEDQMDEVPADMTVARAWGLDTSRHLALRGRYWRRLALPDRWVSWWPAAVAAGLWLIRRERPSAIWSTYPIATAHLIGASLQRLTGLPWVADFRDVMSEPDYPVDPVAWRHYRRIEARTIGRCARAVFTAPGALAAYRERYPALGDRGRVIANGYDEANFAAATPNARTEPRPRLELLHSGALYPDERDPGPFFRALAMLQAAGDLDAGRLRVTFRASGHDAVHRAAADAAGVGGIVAFEPPLGYAAALGEIMAADGLLLFQAANCNHQIPAKVYEYARSGRPIFALTDSTGDTAATLRETGAAVIVPLDDASAIAEGLKRWLIDLREDRAPGTDRAVAARYERRALTEFLADELNAVTGAEG